MHLFPEPRYKLLQWPTGGTNLQIQISQPLATAVKGAQVPKVGECQQRLSQKPIVGFYGNPCLTHPTTQPRDYHGGDTKRGGGGLLKVKKQVDFKFHYR